MGAQQEMPSSRPSGTLSSFSYLESDMAVGQVKVDRRRSLKQVR